jgi:hypothetical protein
MFDVPSFKVLEMNSYRAVLIVAQACLRWCAGSLLTGVLCLAEDLLARAANDPEVEQQLIKRMRGLLAPFVLRRLKSELAEQMVTKNHKLHEVRLHTVCTCLHLLTSVSASSQHGCLRFGWEGFTQGQPWCSACDFVVVFHACFVFVCAGEHDS